MSDETNGQRLPAGWEWATLEDVSSIIMGQSPPSETYNIEGIGLPFYQGKAEFGPLYPSPVKWCSHPGKRALPQDVLISVRAPVGPTNMCRQESCIGRGLAAIRAAEGVNNLYILYLLRSTEQELASKATGTTFSAISGDVLREHKLPLPPTAEQQRIVAEIEKQLTRLDAGVAGLNRTRVNLRRYRASVLKAACEGRLVAQDPNDEPASILLERIQTERRASWEALQRAKGKDPQKLVYPEPASPDIENLPELPEGWCWVGVEQLGTINEQAVLTGPFGSNLGKADFTDVGVLLLTIGCLTTQGLTLDKAFYISEGKAEELGNYRVRAGDILFSRMASVGRAAMVPPKFAGAVINYHLMRLRLAEKIIEPNYFISFVQGSSTASSYIRSVNHGFTRDGINTTQLLAMPVSLPPLAEQQRIVAEVERRLSVVDELEATITANLKRAGRLRQAILKRAFSGKLVPQDPNDEPASVLLDRIQEQRAAASNAAVEKKAKRSAAPKAKRRSNRAAAGQERLL